MKKGGDKRNEVNYLRRFRTVAMCVELELHKMLAVQNAYVIVLSFT